MLLGAGALVILDGCIATDSNEAHRAASNPAGDGLDQTSTACPSFRKKDLSYPPERSLVMQ
jgi:hypothetical protein